jgi:hypothetical protein
MDLFPERLRIGKVLKYHDGECNIDGLARDWGILQAAAANLVEVRPWRHAQVWLDANILVCVGGKKFLQRQIIVEPLSAADI